MFEFLTASTVAGVIAADLLAGNFLGCSGCEDEPGLAPVSGIIPEEHNRSFILSGSLIIKERLVRLAGRILCQ